MIHIAVCEDDLHTAEWMERLLTNIEGRLADQIEVSIFYSGESFTKAIKSNCPYDIILMDIEMYGVNGIEAGSILRSNEENDSVQLIYISSHEEYHLELFDVQPSGFIKKPIDPKIFQEKLHAAIQKGIRRQQQGKKNFLPIHQKGREILIAYRDILYLESSARKVILHMKADCVAYYSTLNEEEKKLPGIDFIRVHQSYIVNSYFIKEIRSRQVILTTGIELPISEKKSAEVKRNYLNFRGNLLG